MWKLLAMGAAALSLGACATIPAPLAGQFPTVSPENAANAAADGNRVRWGGDIVRTMPGPQETCIYALSRTLDASARPRPQSPSSGRFVACRQGFHDPEIFAKGREITVVGTLNGTLTRKVGEYDYPYPRVDADVIYLWPERVARADNWRYRGYPYYDPFWGPPGWNPFWYRRPVIVVPVRPPPPPPPPKGP